MSAGALPIAPLAAVAIVFLAFDLDAPGLRLRRCSLDGLLPQAV